MARRWFGETRLSTSSSDIRDRWANLSDAKRRVLAARLNVASRGVPERIERADSTAPIPASFAQRRLWFLDRLHPGSIAYNNAHALHLTGSLNVSCLRDAVQQIADRHDALRSRFRLLDDVPMIQVDSALKIEMPMIDLSALPPAERKLEVERLEIEAATAPFDLATGPLVHFKLLRLSDREHVLVYVVHHIASDRWSLGIFVRELLQSIDENSPQSAPSVRYLDYAAWQHRSTAAFQAHRDFWREALSPLPPPFELHPDHPRPAMQSNRGRKHDVSLPPKLIQSLSALAQSRGTTLFTVMLAAFEVFLFRYTGLEDGVLGTAVAGRNHIELEPLIGLFVNVLPVRCQVHSDLSFDELLGTTRATIIGAIEHQDLPFDALVDILQLPRDPSRSPLFQILFNYHNVPAPTRGAGELAVEVNDIDAGTARFDLSLTITPRTEGLTCSFEYCRDLFEPATIERMGENFITLLEGIVADPSARVGTLPILSARQRQELVVDWNRDTIDSAPDRCVHEMFEDQVHYTPEALALIVGVERLSYAEVNRRANQVAHRLRAMGVGPESLVGVCLRRNAHLVPAILGILKSGGAYVPLDPEYPPQRLAFMLEDSKCSVFVTEESLLASLLFVPPAVLCVDRDGPAIAEEPHADPPRISQPNHLAYVIYTSGSTGKPKGVAIEHRAPASLARWAREAYSDAEMKRMLALASVCFDLSVFEFFLPLTRGGAIILAANALQLGECPAASEATFAFIVPSVFAELLRTGAFPRNLRGLALGGEAVPEGLARRANELAGIEAVYNLYGPTEDTVISLGYRIPRNEGRAPPVGRSIGGGRAYLLDQRGQPVPMGVAGELHLGGIKVARGYLHRPELTADRFVTDPFGPSGSRLYRTGDLCRFRHDGNIQFISRTDHQIKIRGFRVELGEIESVLSQHAAVRQCCVKAEGDGADRRLIAYLTSTTPRPTAQELRRHLLMQLPDHMVPSAFVYLEAMPLNPSGKIDRTLLTNLHGDQAVSVQESTQAATELQTALLRVWSKVLGVERIGLNDNFFELGGHSLRAVRAVALIEESTGRSVPLRAIFEHATIAKLSAHIQANHFAASDRGQSRESAPDDASLSPAQRTVWFEHHLAGQSEIYNVTVARRLIGTLDPSRLEHSLNAVIRRHEILRTCFPSEEGKPSLKTSPPDAVRVSVPVIDLRAIPGDLREAESARQLRAESATPFSLDQLPLLRAKLFRLSDEEWVFALVIHHIAIDDWSIRILLHEMSEVYTGREGLPSISGSYTDFAAFERRWLSSPAAQKQLDYWKVQLEGARPLFPLPTDRPRPPTQTFRGAREQVEFTADVVRRLHNLSKSERATTFMTLLAAFNVLLMQWSGETDLVIATPSANRQRADVQGRIGYFLNMLPVRTKLSADLTFREVIRRVRRITIDAFDHQLLPFETLIERLRPRRSASYTPWAQVMFVHLTEEPPQLNLPGVRSTAVQVSGGGAKCDLILLLQENEGRVDGNVEYNTDLFDQTSMQQLARRFESLVEMLVIQPDSSVGAPYKSAPLLEPTREIVALPDERNHSRAATEIERKLIAIWKDVLGVSQLDVQDDFFELGGNSLLVMRLLSRIRTELGLTLPIGALFGAATIAKLGALIEADRDPSSGAPGSDDVVTIQANGDGLPLFLVPGMEGHAMVFRKLAGLLGNDYPIHALQLTKLANWEAESPSMQDIAARTIAQMQRVRPRGPYLLAGYSFGGTLAYEMACQLRAAGHQINLVALFDSFPPGLIRTKPFIQRLPVHVSHLVGNGITGAVRHLALIAQRIRMRVSHFLAGTEMPPENGGVDPISCACRAAYQHYHPQHFDGEVVLFAAIHRDRWKDFSVADYLNGWSGLVRGEVVVYSLPVNHRTIFDEAHLGELARQFTHCLKRRAFAK